MAKKFSSSSPMIKEEILIDNWAMLAGKVPNYPSPDWIFRGVSDYPNQKLIPGIARPGTRKDARGGKSGEDLGYNRAEELKMFEEFKRLARPYFTFPMTDLECLALAQHHGMPTRLLDWTDSLLVASFFALEQAGARGKIPAVYALSTYSIESVETPHFNPFGEDKLGVMIYRPPHISPRIPAQQGLFTIHFEPDKKSVFVPLKLHVFKLPSVPKAFRLKEALDYAGFNLASLFPDLDGLTRQITWKHKWGKLP